MLRGVVECSPYDQISKCQKKGDFSASERVRSRHEISVVPMPSAISAVTSGVLVTSIVVVTSVGSVKGAFFCDGLCSLNECCAYYNC